MSDLAKAFAGLKAERPGTHVPTRPSAPGAKDVAKFIRAGQRAQAAVDALVAGPRLAPLPLEGTAKSRHPEYTPVKVFLRKDTHKAAGRKWQDDQETWPEAVREREGGDFSDLVEHLLEEYLRA